MALRRHAAAAKKWPLSTRKRMLAGCHQPRSVSSRPRRSFPRQELHLSGSSGPDLGTQRWLRAPATAPRILTPSTGGGDRLPWPLARLVRGYGGKLIEFGLDWINAIADALHDCPTWAPRLEGGAWSASRLDFKGLFASAARKRRRREFWLRSSIDCCRNLC